MGPGEDVRLEKSLDGLNGPGSFLFCRPKSHGEFMKQAGGQHCRADWGRFEFLQSGASLLMKEECCGNGFLGYSCGHSDFRQRGSTSKCHTTESEAITTNPVEVAERLELAGMSAAGQGAEVTMTDAVAVVADLDPVNSVGGDGDGDRRGARVKSIVQ